MSDRSGSHVDYRDSVGIVTLSGEMDIVRAHDLREQLLHAVRNEDLGLVVDLTNTTYIDSVGVSLLFELAERLSERQLRLAVVLPEAGLVERVLRIVNLDSVTEIHPTVDEAVGAIRAADGGSPA
jgi:anti-anti-sigma factor